MVETAKQKGPKRVAVVAPHDQATLMAASQAQKEGLAHSILVGDSRAMKGTADECGLDLAEMVMVDEPLPKLAARKAVELANEGQVDLIMNGLVRSRHLIEIVRNQSGFEEQLTEVGVFDIPGFNRLILVSDIGVLVSPALEQKARIAQNAIHVAQRLGVEEPKVAVLSPTEVVNPKIPISLEAAGLSKMAQRGQIKGGLVEGPLALDLAISPRSARIKGITGKVAGQADILIAPDLETGSLLAQIITCLARGRMARVIVGGKYPLTMPSRADPTEAKLASLALGVLMTSPPGWRSIWLKSRKEQ